MGLRVWALIGLLIKFANLLPTVVRRTGFPHWPGPGSMTTTVVREEWSGFPIQHVELVHYRKYIFSYHTKRGRTLGSQTQIMSTTYAIWKEF